MDDAVDQPAVPEEDPGHQGNVVHEEDAVVVDKDGGTTAGYLLHAEYLVVVVELGDVSEAGSGLLQPSVESGHGRHDLVPAQCRSVFINVLLNFLMSTGLLYELEQTVMTLDLDNLVNAICLLKHATISQYKTYWK